MGTSLTDTELGEQVLGVAHTAFRLELQPAYIEPIEAETLARFLAGTPDNPPDVPFLHAWFDRIRQLTQDGKRIERVRIIDEPPTGYQKWARLIGWWSTAAGEHIRYLTRTHAHHIGLLPAAGNTDWWLLDNNRLILMHFDPAGTRTSAQLTTDPATIEQACAWRDLAVRHSVPDNPEDALVV